MGKIEVFCRTPGFRRLGREHPARKVYEADHFTEEELVILRADPEFEVRMVDGADAAATEARNAAAAGDPGGTAAALAVAPGADAADQVSDNGAGPSEPHLDGTPGSGTGPDAGPAPADTGEGGTTSPETDRVAAIRGVLGEIGDDERTREGRPKVAVLEKKLGFKPSVEEIEAAMQDEKGQAAG
ncbi:hypothetical protein [Afifella pfennigii]|uniref:hypothetical protein n=1 Tax=Afifella pfennigii TaxID=209897 RepID=UPI00047B0709|nr:hypothetical protein [Afifella pfennigii]